MGQVAFDTQEFVEKLENAGLNREQAKAITLVVRESHEVADLATKADIKDVKRDLEDVRKELSADIAEVRKDLTIQIADVRKDMHARFEKTEAKNDAQMALLRKDVEALASGLFIKLSKVMLAIVGISVTIATAIIKLL
ncbi:hypothetical protein SOPEG_1040 [Candidatus Sodalis pierantonius str. SOPE]|uniref:Uncharacterized protein n=1 Tax=Candidatus Sodalis pierantonii str. SOPE TaxID=2342 RepID=W0HMS2_9GAMM|nr:hypothetical protein [Candidatus Sodalis pierantonius]AHF73398.1 hypothetical protein SOPEG_1040 [Candidatus Sodalis pierantonius str. SOPE]